MKKTFLLSALALVALATSATTVNYTVDDNTDFWNPERGFYHYSDVILDGQGGGGLGSGNIQSCKNDNMSLLFRYFYLNRYNRGTAITQKDLNMIANDFAVARANGVKLIVRFSYGSDGYRGDDDWSFTEPTKAQMQAHMAQLKPVLAANADVIACVQAGFVGIWGEWYFSSTFGKDWSKPNALSDRNDLIDSLLAMTPDDRCLQLRTIHYITEYFGNGSPDYNTTLNDQTAFSGSKQSRIGHHNDAFCADKQNQGTYFDYTNERNYLANLSQYVPVGGENNDYNSTYSTGAKAMADMERFHYDYLNTEYYSGTISNWKSQQKDGVSYYDIMKRRLGYRLQLQSLTYNNQVAPNAKLNITLQIKNSGFSNLYNKRTGYIVLKNSSHTYKLPLASDPRLWKAGLTTTVTESLSIPSNAANGTYDLYLWLPDQYASLQNDPRYSVQMANSGNLFTSDGMNKLSAQVTITGTPSGDDDDDEPEPQSTAPCAIAVDLSSAHAMTQQTGSATWTQSGDVLTVSYSIQGGDDNWPYTGVEFAMNNRTDIDSVSFEFKGTGGAPCWVAFFPYFLVGNDRLVDGSLDVSIHEDNGWQHITLRPNKVLWGGDFSYNHHAVSQIGFMANAGCVVSSSFQIRNVYIYAQCPVTPTEQVQISDSPAHFLPMCQETPGSPLKLIRNGRFLILRNNHLYSPLGF